MVTTSTRQGWKRRAACTAGIPAVWLPAPSASASPTSSEPCTPGSCSRPPTSSPATVRCPRSAAASARRNRSAKAPASWASKANRSPSANSNASSATGSSNTAPPRHRPHPATGTRSPSSAAARPGWPARATLRNWAMKSRSSRRCTRRAAYWSTASPSSGCPRSASWHAKSPRSKNWA